MTRSELLAAIEIAHTAERAAAIAVFHNPALAHEWYAAQRIYHALICADAPVTRDDFAFDENRNGNAA